MYILFEVAGSRNLTNILKYECKALYDDNTNIKCVFIFTEEHPSFFDVTVLSFDILGKKMKKWPLIWLTVKCQQLGKGRLNVSKQIQNAEFKFQIQNVTSYHILWASMIVNMDFTLPNEQFKKKSPSNKFY